MGSRVLPVPAGFSLTGPARVVGCVVGDGRAEGAGARGWPSTSLRARGQRSPRTGVCREPVLGGRGRVQDVSLARGVQEVGGSGDPPGSGAGHSVRGSAEAWCHAVAGLADVRGPGIWRGGKDSVAGVSGGGWGQDWQR